MGTTASNLTPAGLPVAAPCSDTNITEGALDKAASRCPVTFGTVLMTGDQTVVWHVELRRICSSIKRELQSNLDSAACGTPCQYCSPAFKLPADETDLQWQLSFVPLEFSVDSVSLYLQVADPHRTAFGKSVIAQLTMTVSSQQRAGSALSAAANTEACRTFDPSATRQSVQQLVCLEGLQQFHQASYAVVQLQVHSIHWQSTLPLPGLLMSADPHITLISLQPRILLIENFLSAADCKGVIALAQPDLHRSRVARGKKAFHADIQCFEERVSQLIHLPAVMHGRRPLTKGEAVQVVRYQAGEFYAEHFDNKADDCSKRACTIMAYLSDVDAGGETYFRRSNGYPGQGLQPSALTGKLQGLSEGPHSRQTPLEPEAASSASTGLKIPPKRGRAIMFWSRGTNGEEDRASLHSGERVQQGEKWIASRWLQEEATCCTRGNISIEE